MFCESFHRVFKCKYLKGRLHKTVYKCLLNLIKLNRDKIFERFSKLTKGKYISRMRFIKESHEASKRISFNNVEVINEKIFKVKSEEGVKLYDVSKVNERCSAIVAKWCALSVGFVRMNALAHALIFLLPTNVCKHIHLVGSVCVKRNTFQVLRLTSWIMIMKTSPLKSP